jgi:isoamylase
MSRPRPRVLGGAPYPLGATAYRHGVNLAIFSANATRVELCLFDPDGRESARLDLPEYTDEIWHGFFPSLRAGQFYGYRLHGPYEPRAGHRYNPNKLLIDPYARLLSGNLEWNDAHYGYTIGSGDAADLTLDQRDSAQFMPKCVVTGVEPGWRPQIAWGRTKFRPTAWCDTIIYEAHVGGLSKRNAELREAIRGTFAALQQPSTIEYLVKLGVTAIELMPVHSFFDDAHLAAKGLRNYWGYSTLNFFAPAPRFLSPGGDLREIKEAVRRLHEAGIEVILDVVYNHTMEGNHLGPTLSFRGIDNASYYKLADDPRFYFDTTGCGNTLNLGHPRVLQLVMDSLRYWVDEFRIDGFRFDLATSLGREEREFRQDGSFFAALRQDPVLSTVKLIAEPWDLGEGGYRLGDFPPGWGEWNGRFRDNTRSYWKGDEGYLSALSKRLLGSADLFEKRGRRPWASINFVTAHDGFTLRDLYSYSEKKNGANLEDNHDGHNDNRSWNCGVEGDTDVADILDLRDRMRRNLMATLLLSQGTPMMLMGDEVGRTQLGNNNAYCQDNEISWLQWRELSDRDRAFLEFVCGLNRLRRSHPLLRQPRFLHGEIVREREVPNVVWLRPDAKPMAPSDWDTPMARSVAMLLADREGRFLLLLTNASHVDVPYESPRPDGIGQWRLLVDTARGLIEPGEPVRAKGMKIDVPARSLLLFQGGRR